jgi:glyoxylase-like metal-dependent hydrolase (beta-lactamase superfamily II)
MGMTNPLAVQEIEANELARKLDAGEDIQLLDVRAPFRLANGGYIELGELDRFINVAGSELMALPDPASAGLEREVPVVTVCGHGNSSRTVAQWLMLRGYNVMSLAGGMAAWMDVVLPRELAAPTSFDKLVQVDRVGKGALGYMVASNGEALVIDPPRDTAAYEAEAARLGVRIVGVVDTHVHADYISGAPQLATKLGVPYYLHAADSSYAFDGTPGKLAFTAINEGDVIKVGNGVVKVLYTPGHTEGSVTLLAGDAAFTGDLVFITSVGRPDLAGKAAEWTAQLFDSLTRAKQNWSLETRIFPAHYSGKPERTADHSVWASFGEVRSINEPLRIEDPAEFTAWVNARLKDAPQAYRYIKAINVGLMDVEPHYASELEAGKNECAVG